MSRKAKFLLSAGIVLFGAVVWVALSVYPMQYDPVESSILVGLLVLFGLFEFVLDEAIVGR